MVATVCASNIPFVSEKCKLSKKATLMGNIVVAFYNCLSGVGLTCFIYFMVKIFPKLERRLITSMKMCNAYMQIGENTVLKFRTYQI